jgi:hypothetical protein
MGRWDGGWLMMSDVVVKRKRMPMGIEVEMQKMRENKNANVKLGWLSVVVTIAIVVYWLID